MNPARGDQGRPTHFWLKTVEGGSKGTTVMGGILPELHIRPTTSEIAQAGAEFVVGLAEESQFTQSRCIVVVGAMSGSP